MATSWQPAGRWYHQAVGEKGHYYHQHVIVPHLGAWITELKPRKILDLGCGQGVLARHLPPGVDYVGVDSASNLIHEAQKLSPHRFLVADMTRPLPLPADFDLAVFLLSLQNTDRPQDALQTAARHLQPGGALILVLNHPCFRIPRQSGWGTDSKTKLQYRFENRYLSPLKIPVRIHPSRGNQSAVAWSYHHALTDVFAWLHAAGFVTVKLEEWTSDKQSEGQAAKSENRARAEFPLFLSMMCVHS